MTAATATTPPQMSTRGGSRGWDRTDQLVLSTFVVVVVLTQRIGIPFADTAIGIALPLTYITAAFFLVRHRFTVSRLRAELLLIALIGCLGVTAAVSISGSQLSMSSLMFLVAVYLPFVLRIAGNAGRPAVWQAGRVFVRVMLLLAVVGIVQLVSQLLGVWQYRDYLADYVPAEYLMANYNTAIPLVYGSSTYKSYAIVLLEPSFLSQLAALAIIIGLVLRVRAWQLVVLVAGMASAVSGTGILLLLCGVVLLLVRAPRAIRPRYVVAGVVAIGLVLLSPVASLLLDRSGEVAQPGTSGYARFVRPYTSVLNGLDADPLRFLIGGGAGNSERLLASNRDGVGEVILYSVVPKLAFEYGLIAGGLFLLFLVFSVLDGAPWRVVPGSMLFMTVVLSGALLQPQTAALLWVFTMLGSTPTAARNLRAPSRGTG